MSAMTPGVRSATERLRSARLRFFEYRHEADAVTMTALAVGFAALTGVAAQVRIPLPFSPVPITLQTFAVLLAGVVLGARYGGASQGAYVGLGAAGVPWFTGAGAGVSHLAGPTGGYLLGFVVAAGLIGWLTGRNPANRRGARLLVVLAAGNALIYAAGLPVLWAWLALIQGSAPTHLELASMGLLPFLVGDAVKLLAAAGVAHVVTPARSDFDAVGTD